MSELRNGIGPSHPRLVLIGEAWGQEEEKAQEPFVGKAGQFLDKFLQRAGLRRDEVYITNVCNAHPSPGSNDISPIWSPRTGFTPIGLEHKERLLGELGRFQPGVVLVPLGNVALDALIARRDITVCRGYPWKWSGRTVIPSLHPSYLMRGQFAEMPLLQWDLQKALKWHGPSTPILHRARTIEQVREAFRRAWESTDCAHDIEVIALDGIVTCFSLCWNEREAVSIPFGGFWNGQREIVRLLLKEFMEAEKGPRIITQNGNFDTFFEEHYLDIHPNLDRVDDLMVAHSVIWPQLTGGGVRKTRKRKTEEGVVEEEKVITPPLRLIGSIHTDLPFWKDESWDARKTGDFDRYQDYNSLDSFGTRFAWMSKTQNGNGDVRGKLGENGLLYTYQKTMERLPYAQGMQRAGMAVDTSRLIQLRRENREAVQGKQVELEGETRGHNEVVQRGVVEERYRLEEQIFEVEREWHADNAMRKYVTGEARIGKCAAAEPLRKALEKLKGQSKTLEKGFNPRSHKQSVALFQAEGLRPTRNRKTGNVSVGAKALEAAAKKGSRTAGLMQTIRELRTEYDSQLTWNVDPLDERFRYSANIRGTETGRFSNSTLFFHIGTNAQSFTPLARSILVADPGHVLVNVDLPGAEWVVTAWLTGCEKMLEATKRNIHAYTAHLMTGLPYDTILLEHKAVGDERDPERIAAIRAALPEPHLSHVAGLSNLARDGSIRQNLGKRPGLALNYRMGWHEYAEQTGQAAREAKEQVARYHSAYPGLLTWWREVEMQVAANRYVETLQGTLIPMMGAIRGKEADQTYKSAIAAIPQGTIANHTHSAGVKLHRAGFDLRMNGHDALLIQLPLAGPVETLQQIERIVAAFNIPLKSKHGEFRLLPEVKMGLNWGPRDKGNPVGLRDVRVALESVADVLKSLSPSC